MRDYVDELSERNLAMIPKGVRAKELLQMVYRGEVQLTPQQMRAAEKCLEFEEPKVSAVAVGHFDGKDFATQLEKAIARSKQPAPASGAHATCRASGQRTEGQLSDAKAQSAVTKVEQRLSRLLPML